MMTARPGSATFRGQVDALGKVTGRGHPERRSLRRLERGLRDLFLEARRQLRAAAGLTGGAVRLESEKRLATVERQWRCGSTLTSEGALRHGRATVAVRLDKREAPCDRRATVERP
jgi:hypothetical protein